MRYAASILASAAIALGAGAVTPTPATAAPLVPQPLVHDAESGPPNLIDVQYRRHGYHGGRVYRSGRYPYRYHYPRRYRDRAGVALGAGLLGFALGSALTAPRYPVAPGYYDYRYYAGPPPHGYPWRGNIEDPASGVDRTFP